MPLQVCSRFHVVFHGLAKLKTLHLEYNSLTSLLDHSFVSFGQLRELVLRSNNISMITKHAFFGLTNLTCLDLSMNRIRMIDLGDLQVGISVCLRQNALLRIHRLTGLKAASPSLYFYRWHQVYCTSGERGTFCMTFSLLWGQW